MIRRRAPFVKLPGDGRSRFLDTELTQSFETGTVTTRPSRRQIVNAAAQSVGLTGSGGVTGALCCGDVSTGGGTGVGTVGVTGTSTTDATLTAKVTGLRSNMDDVTQNLTNQSTLNTEYSTLINDLYTQSGYTPPFPVPTDPGSGSGV